jgi:quinol monooxygenase YgiN
MPTRSSPDQGPAVVTAHVWTLRPRHAAHGMRGAALRRGSLQRRTGARFAALLGTGRGERFTVRDAQLLTWVLIASWDDPADADAFEHGRYARAWSRRSARTVRLELQPLSSRGAWGGAEPFGAPRGAGWDGQVAALTRARIRPRRLLRFHRAIGPVAAQLRASEGCRWAIGFGEAPVGWQGTLSVWSDAAALREFAYRGAAHADVVHRTPQEGWYSEELFARFGVLRADGLPGSVSAAAVPGAT